MGRQASAGYAALAGLVIGLVPTAASALELDVSGRWRTPDQSSTVEISDCGDGTPCGVVVAVEPRHGGMAIDHHNREPALRGRQMIGITLLDGFEDREGEWCAGAIYNPKDGRTYRARLHLLSEDSLAVSGCLGPICKNQVWERASADDRGTIAEGQRAALHEGA